MSKDKEIREIERIKSSLEYHFERYRNYKYDAKNSSKKDDRNRASENMCIEAKLIEKELLNPLVLREIYNGNPYQFEDFWKYVDSDLPGYLSKIDSLLEKLKSEKEAE